MVVSGPTHPPSGDDATQMPGAFDVVPVAENVSVLPPTTGTSTGELVGAVSAVVLG